MLKETAMTIKLFIIIIKLEHSHVEFRKYEFILFCIPTLFFKNYFLEDGKSNDPVRYTPMLDSLKLLMNHTFLKDKIYFKIFIQTQVLPLNI